MLNIYKRKSKLKSELLGRGGTWLDTGSIKDFYNTSYFVSTLENRQGLKIACLEEIALKNKWIKKNDVKEAIKFYGKCLYSDYLNSFIKIKLMTKVLVTGGNSRFATKLKETKSRYNFIYTNKKQFNILNFPL